MLRIKPPIIHAWNKNQINVILQENICDHNRPVSANLCSPNIPFPSHSNLFPSLQMHGLFQKELSTSDGQIPLMHQASNSYSSNSDKIFIVNTRCEWYIHPIINGKIFSGRTRKAFLCLALRDLIMKWDWIIYEIYLWFFP